MVRTDVTYLRQDFSLLLTDAAADPPTQRFDYLVRTRVLSHEEAESYQAEIAQLEETSPYREIALDALRRLTDSDAGTSAEQWRHVLWTNWVRRHGPWFVLGGAGFLLFFFRLLLSAPPAIARWARHGRAS